MNIKYAILKILILLAYADKQFHENEKKMIIKICDFLKCCKTLVFIESLIFN